MPRGSEATQGQGLALGIPLVKTEQPTDTYADIEGDFYLYWMYAASPPPQRMTGYWIADWTTAVRATYEDNTHIWGGGTSVFATYEGIEIARNTDRFLPWRENETYAYSVKGGLQRWTLPAVGKERIRAEMLVQGLAVPRISESPVEPSSGLPGRPLVLLRISK